MESCAHEAHSNSNSRWPQRDGHLRFKPSSGNHTALITSKARTTSLVPQEERPDEREDAEHGQRDCQKAGVGDWQIGSSSPHGGHRSPVLNVGEDQEYQANADHEDADGPRAQSWSIVALRFVEELEHFGNGEAK